MQVTCKFQKGNNSFDRDGQGSFMEESEVKQGREERKDMPGWCVYVWRCVGATCVSTNAHVGTVQSIAGASEITPNEPTESV